MIGESTIELVRQVKAQRENTIVIMLTLSPDSAGLEALFEAGAGAAISKAAPPMGRSRRSSARRWTVVSLHPHRPSRSVGSSAGSSGVAVGVEESPLSARELEVLGLVAAGSTNGEIARKLWVTDRRSIPPLEHLSQARGRQSNRGEPWAHVNGMSGGPPAVAS